MVVTAFPSVIIEPDVANIDMGNRVMSDIALILNPVRRESSTVRWKVASVVLVVFAVVAGTSYGIWFIYYRPYTPEEVYLHEHWKDGDVRDVEGTITEIHYFNTTYGREVYLQLADKKATSCAGVGGIGFIRGDINRQYAVGETFRTTLHFKTFRFSNLQGVWAEELVCPIPAFLHAIGIFIDSVALSMGISLIPEEMNETGWMYYDVKTWGGQGYPLHVVNVQLAKAVYDSPGEFQALDGASGWLDVDIAEYHWTYDGYPSMPVIDEMLSLDEGTSRNETIRYSDMNGNNLLDTGDKIVLHLESLSGFQYQTYLISFGGGFTCCGYVCGIKYILNGPNGPYELDFPNEYGSTILRHIGYQIGANVSSTIEVEQEQPSPPIPLSQLNYSLDIRGGRFLFGRLVDLPFITADGVMIAFSDSDGDGLDAGDRFSIGGIANRTTLTLVLYRYGGGGASLTWVAGYGPVVGNIPRVRLATEDAHSPLTINVSVPWWHQELNLSRQLTVSLWENSILVLNESALTNGSVGSFPGGDLTFVDADADGFLSSNDYFVLNGKAQAVYELEISVLWGYANFHQEFGPI